MAQAFLEQLLRIENTVRVDQLDAPTCIVCLESFGTLSSSTGAVELQVRMPCGHLVGTICIATWLRDNNSCPVCRATFFPAQPRPYLEHGILNDSPSANRTRSRARDARSSTRSPRIYYPDYFYPVHMCDLICDDLVLDHDVKVIAQLLTEPLSRMLHGRQHPSAADLAAICIYIAWHLLGPDDNIMNFLANLRDASGISQDYIFIVYRRIYPDRVQLIVPEMLPMLVRSHTEGILAFLPAPDAENGSTNREDESDREARTGNEIDHNTFDPLETRERESGDLDEIRGQLDELTIEGPLAELLEVVAEQLLVNMATHSLLSAASLDLRAVVCIFIACHIMGVGVSYSDIARTPGVSERRLRETYADVFPRRGEIVNSGVAEIIGRDNLERALGAFSALNWPPEDAEA